jgi:hypothetical protein
VTSLLESPGYIAADQVVRHEVEAIDAAMQKLGKLMSYARTVAQEMLKNPVTWLYGGEVYAGSAILILDQSQDKLQEAIDKIATYLEWTGRPSRLRAVASVWRDDVLRPVSETVALFSVSGMDIDDWWKGKAAEEYANHLPMQQAALSSLCEKANGVSGALNMFAQAVIGFWYELRSQIVKAVAAMVDIIGNLDPQKPWQFLANFWSGLLNIVDDLWNHVRAKAEEFTKLVQDIQVSDADNRAFPNERWPGPHRTFERPAWIPDGEDG